MSTVTSAEEITVPVMVTRNNTSGELSINYETEASADGIFTDDGNGTVHFAPGVATATINVKASNLQKGTTYTYKMKLDTEKQDVDTVFSKAVQEMVVEIVSDYTWVEAGTCTFIDGNFDGGTAEDVTVEQALENKTVFRIVEPYQTLFEGTEDEEFFADADNIVFYLNEDGSPNSVKTDAYFGGSYTLMYLSSYPSYCYFECDGNVFTVGHLIGVDGAPTYIGGFQFIYDVPSLQ